jgi:flagellar protein FlbD
VNLYIAFTVYLQGKKLHYVKVMGGNTRNNKETAVILITRTNGTQMYINAELIQSVEATPDTVITLAGNKKLIVKDSPHEIAQRFIEYRRKTLAPIVSPSTAKS